MNHGNDNSLHSLLFQIMRLHRSRMMTLLGKLDVHHGQAPVLGLLTRQDGWTQKEIAAKLHLRPATVTDILQRMEKAGLLLRKNDPSDLRVTRVYLTEKSRRLRAEVDKAMAAHEAEWTRGFTPAELEQLQQYFIRIRDNLLQTSDDEPDWDRLRHCLREKRWF